MQSEKREPLLGLDNMAPPSLVGLDVARYKLSVRRRLIAARITFREVCDEMEVDHSKLSNWLKPKKDLYLSTVCRIERAIFDILQRRKQEV